MATDGVKIIDGDTAHDTYWGIMDLYDGGATVETIRNKFPFPQIHCYDDFDYEIYITSYALAFWEIGFITKDIINEVKLVIEKGACVNVWTEEFDAKEGKKREKELEKLWLKINSENSKIRQRKKYKKIEKFIFDINDVLTFQREDNYYYAAIILNIYQYRGNCAYRFGKIIFQDAIPPTIEKIKDMKIVGRKIPSGPGLDMAKFFSTGMDEIVKQGGVEQMLKKEAERTGSFQIGMSTTSIDHKELINIAHKFTKIGKLNLNEDCRRVGSMGGAMNFEELTRDFSALENRMKIFREDAFLIQELLQK